MSAGDTAFPGCLGWWDCMEEGIGMDIVIGIRIGIGEWGQEHPSVPERSSTENKFLWSLLFPAQGLSPESPESHHCALLVPVLLWVPRPLGWGSVLTGSLLGACTGDRILHPLGPNFNPSLAPKPRWAVGTLQRFWP